MAGVRNLQEIGKRDKNKNDTIKMITRQKSSRTFRRVLNFAAVRAAPSRAKLAWVYQNSVKLNQGRENGGLTTR